MTMLAASPAAAVPTFTQSCFANNLSHAITVADYNKDGKLDITINNGHGLGLAFTFSDTVDLYPRI
jgi:hypothetical protein